MLPFKVTRGLTQDISSSVVVLRWRCWFWWSKKCIIRFK